MPDIPVDVFFNSGMETDAVLPAASVPDVKVIFRRNYQPQNIGELVIEGAEIVCHIKTADQKGVVKNDVIEVLDHEDNTWYTFKIYNIQHNGNGRTTFYLTEHNG